MKVPGSFRQKTTKSWEWRYNGKSMSFKVKTLEQAEWKAAESLMNESDGDVTDVEEFMSVSTREAFELWVVATKPTQMNLMAVELFVKDHSGEPVSSLDGNHVFRWWNRCMKVRKVTGSTMLRYLSSISAWLKWCWGEGHVDTNAVKLCQIKPVKEPTEKVLFTDEQRDRVLEALIEENERVLSLMFTFAFHQGFRLDSIRNIKWKDINWGHPVRPQVKLTVGKNKDTLGDYWLEDKTIEVLKRFTQSATFLFPGCGDTKPLSKDTFYKRRDRWNASHSKDLQLPKTSTHGRAFHVGRHTFATNKLAKGLSYSAVAKMGGWKNGIIVSNTYEHLRDTDVLDGLD